MNLVAQGPGMSEARASELLELTRASSFEKIGHKAFRFRNAKRDAKAWLAAKQIDWALVPEGRRFADLKLLAMDMDSTLITIECIDELGDLAGCKPAIAAITAQAMRGEIDYPESLRRRVSLLKGLEESSLPTIYEQRLKLTPGADALLAACKRNGVKLLLVSGGFTFFTERLKEKLGLDYTISNRLEVREGRLTGGLIGDIVDADAKARKFLSLVAELKIDKSKTVAIGDGANDLKMMAEAGVSVAFRAKPVVRAQASCALSWSGLDAVVNLFE